MIAVAVDYLATKNASSLSTVSSALGTYAVAGVEHPSGVKLLGSLSIAEVSAASGALPVLVVTVLKAVSRNYSCNVVQGVSCRLDSAARANAVSLAREAFVGVAGCRNDNAHAVSNESKSLVKPSAAAVGAGPVCNVSVLGTGCCLSLNSYDSVSCVLVSELATYHTVSVAGEHVGVTKCRDNNVLLVGKLSKSLVSPSCTTVRAVPVCNVSVLGTGCCLSRNSYDSVSCVLIAELATYLTVSIAGEHVRMSECGSLSLLLLVITSGAMCACSKTGLGTGCSLRLVDHHIVTERENNLLLNENLVTYGTNLTLGKTFLVAGCLLSRNDLLGVAKSLTLGYTAIGTSLGCRAGSFCPGVFEGCASCDRRKSKHQKHSQD